MNKVIDEGYFYSMIRKDTASKNRKCLKCRTVFRSFGDRVCGTCNGENSVAGKTASYNNY